LYLLPNAANTFKNNIAITLLHDGLNNLNDLKGSHRTQWFQSSHCNGFHIAMFSLITRTPTFDIVFCSWSPTTPRNKPVSYEEKLSNVQNEKFFFGILVAAKVF